MNPVHTLYSLGLNDKEAGVYLALLQLGKSTGYTVAKHSGLRRSTAYSVLNNLVDRGVVNKIPSAHTSQYMAIDPDDLLSMYENRVLKAREGINELRALNKGRKSKVSVAYYEGLSGIKEMYQKLVKKASGKEVVAFYAHGKHTRIELWDFFGNVDEMFRKKNIKRRGITTSHSSLKKYLKHSHMQKYKIELKALAEKKYNSSVSIEIHKSMVNIISHRNLQGIVIDNIDIGRVMKQIFELVWEREDFVESEK